MCFGLSTKQLLLSCIYDDQCILNDIFVLRFQVGILIRELCRLHNLPLPSDLDNLSLQFPGPGTAAAAAAAALPYGNGNAASKHHAEDLESEDADDADDGLAESDQDSDVEDDLPLEMDEGKAAMKVRSIIFYILNSN